jgi:hypothetical protein
VGKRKVGRRASKKEGKREESARVSAQAVAELSTERIQSLKMAGYNYPAIYHCNNLSL